MRTGFCVIYRWALVPEKEQQFVSAWQSMTDEIRTHAGGLGSRLHKADDGTWVAYAQWPDRGTWERADVTTEPAKAAGEQMAAAVMKRYDPILLEPVADLLEFQTRGNL